MNGLRTTRREWPNERLPLLVLESSPWRRSARLARQAETAKVWKVLSPSSSPPWRSVDSASRPAVAREQGNGLEIISNVHTRCWGRTWVDEAELRANREDRRNLRIGSVLVEGPRC